MCVVLDICMLKCPHRYGPHRYVTVWTPLRNGVRVIQKSDVICIELCMHSYTLYIKIIVVVPLFIL